MNFIARMQSLSGQTASVVRGHPQKASRRILPQVHAQSRGMPETSAHSPLQSWPARNGSNFIAAAQQRASTVAGTAVVERPPPAAAPRTTVDVPLGDRSYPIYIGQGLLDQGELLQRHVPGKRVLIVTNTTIAPLYLER